MELLLLPLIAGVMASGVYLVLDRTLLRVVIGLGLISNATNLSLMVTGGLEAGAAPIISDQQQTMVDPLPQALVLTAIVIGFGVTALLLTLSYRSYQVSGSDDLGELHGRLDDE